MASCRAVATSSAFLMCSRTGPAALALLVAVEPESRRAAGSPGNVEILQILRVHHQRRSHHPAGPRTEVEWVATTNLQGVGHNHKVQMQKRNVGSSLVSVCSEADYYRLSAVCGNHTERKACMEPHMMHAEDDEWCSCVLTSALNQV